MDIIARHKKLKSIISMFAYPTGAYVIEKNFKLTFRTYFGIFLCVLYFVCTIYTLYIFQGQLNKIIECLCVCSGAAQGATKYYQVLSQKKELNSLMDFVDHLYEKNVGKSDKRDEILLVWIQRIEICAKFGTAILIFTILAISVCPVFYYFHSGNLQLMLVVYLPFIDYTSTVGYILNLLIQCLFVTIGVCGNVAADIFFCMQIMHMPAMVGFLEDTFTEIETSLSARKKDPIYTKALLRNALIMHQDIMKFIESVDRSYDYTIFFQITSSTAALAVTLFNIVTSNETPARNNEKFQQSRMSKNVWALVRTKINQRLQEVTNVLKSNWLAAYGFCIMSFAQLWIYCILGTVVEITNDKATHALYAFSWHLLTPPEQKMIALSLARSHRAKELTIAGLAPLNVATGASLLKAVYTYLMMLLNFSE